METIAILELLKDYIILGLKILIPIAITFFIAYGIIYKKIMKGSKRIKKSQLLLYALSIGYVVIIIGATFLSRFQDSFIYNGEINLNLFSSYREAYHHMNIDLTKNTLFRNLILNIMLFMPVGFLLPFYSDKLKKMYKVVLIGFVATLTIELTQHFNNYGVFEIDDIFNNTLGTLLGYCCYMIFERIKNKESWKKIISYTIPIILTIGAFIGIFITYQLQEFGNFEFEYNYKINMKNVDIQSEVQFSKESSMKAVYQIPILDKNQTRQIAEKIFDNLENKIDDKETMEHQNSITYWTPGRQGEADSENVHHIMINYIGGSYTYIGGSNVIFKDGMVEFIKIIKNATRFEVENALNKLGIQVPENASFELNDREQYVFSINMIEQDDVLIDGKLTCKYYDDKRIKEVTNEILTYNKVETREIISQEEAFDKIREGKFSSYNDEKINDILVKSVQLEYKLDSKGFYVPVYKFDVLLNGIKDTIYIKAIK